MKTVLAIITIFFSLGVHAQSYQKDQNGDHLTSYTCLADQLACKAADNCCPQSYKKAAGYFDQMNQKFGCEALMVTDHKEGIFTTVIRSKRCALLPKKGHQCESGMSARNLNAEYKVCVSQTPKQSRGSGASGVD